MSHEEAFLFQCEGDSLCGILHHSKSKAKRGVVLVVGGPQYRVGSHRQFVLLARALSREGTPVLRFDSRGMGDSTGEQRTFESIGKDMERAIDVFMSRSEGLEEVVILGLCDAASAALFYGAGDSRVKGMILLNPWVRTLEGEAKAYIRHYYFKRLLNPDLWKKLVTGKFNLSASLKSLYSTTGNALGISTAEKTEGDPQTSLPARMRKGLAQFSGHVLFILSGNDLTAAEFNDLVSADSEWTRLMQRETVVRKDLDEADHTFSREKWRRQVEYWVEEWIKSW